MAYYAHARVALLQGYTYNDFNGEYGPISAAMFKWPPERALSNAREQYIGRKVEWTSRRGAKCVSKN